MPRTRKAGKKRIPSKRLVARDPFTQRQRTFLLGYQQHGIGWRAAAEAGYCYGDRIQCSKYASDLLKMPHIAEALNAWNEARAARFNATPERIIEELAKIAFGGLQNIVRIDGNGQPVIDLSYCTADELGALAEITVDTYQDGFGDEARPVKTIKAKGYNKLQALELLGKLTRFRLFANQTIELHGDIGELISQARQRRRELQMKTVEETAAPRRVEFVEHGATVGDGGNSQPAPLLDQPTRRQAPVRDIRPINQERRDRLRRAAG